MSEIKPYGADEASGLWVYLEQEEGELVGVSLELLGKSREMADRLKIPLTGLLLGHEVGHLPEQAFAVGADEVLIADHPDLKVYNTEPYTRVVAEAVAERKPSILLLGATPDGRDLAGRLAVRVHTGLTADCTDMDVDPEKGLLKGDVVGFGGGIVATILCPDMRPQMATVRPGIFAPPEPKPGRKGKVVEIPVNVREEDRRVQVVERVTAAGLDLTKTPCIVAAGRGVRGELDLVWELAKLFGGDVGATRVACDEGWLERERQIGQTGVVTRPKLAICCGISGAIHFTVGIEGAETVVAINTDEEAPIFEAADFCVVDDLFAVLSPLVELARRASNGGQS
jgi:electron transfer flavoprotein alpha subunit